MSEFDWRKTVSNIEFSPGLYMADTTGFREEYNVESGCMRYYPVRSIDDQIRDAGQARSNGAVVIAPESTHVIAGQNALFIYKYGI